MSDVRERAAVNECRSVLERLHEIRQNGVPEEHRHGSIDAELLAAESFFESAGQSTDPPPMHAEGQPALQIVSVGNATREDASTLRVPLVLGDAEGTTAEIALSIRIETVKSDPPR